MRFRPKHLGGLIVFGLWIAGLVFATKTTLWITGLVIFGLAWGYLLQAIVTDSWRV